MAPSLQLLDLPSEIIALILTMLCRQSRERKQSLLNIRLVCKKLEIHARPFVFRCISLDYTNLSNATSGSQPLDYTVLDRMGHLTDSLSLDFMVVRGFAECAPLMKVLKEHIPSSPEVISLLTLAEKCCTNMGECNIEDFRHALNDILIRIPQLKSLKLSLPFPILGKYSRTATRLFATTLADIAKRDPEISQTIDCLVLDQLSDRTIRDICSTHIDVGNAFNIFSGLKRLYISLMREIRMWGESSFGQLLWLLISKAVNLESLALVKSNSTSNPITRMFRNYGDTHLMNQRLLPYHDGMASKLIHLRCLELKHLDLQPDKLFNLIADTAPSLKDLQLIHVNLSIFNFSHENDQVLWIGRPDQEQPQSYIWVSQRLRDIPDLKLEIFRVSELGYSPNIQDHDIDPMYDTVDPLGLERNFDVRFLSAFKYGIQESESLDAPRRDVAESSLLPISNRELARTRAAHALRTDWDALYHQEKGGSSASDISRSLDGVFVNKNERATKQLQDIITILDRGSDLVDAQLRRVREEGVAVPTVMTLPEDVSPVNE